MNIHEAEGSGSEAGPVGRAGGGRAVGAGGAVGPGAAVGVGRAVGAGGAVGAGAAVGVGRAVGAGGAVGAGAHAWAPWAFGVLTVGALLTASPVDAQLPPDTECGPRLHAGESTGALAFPQGDFFCPLIADPKQPRSFLSYLKGTSPAEAGPDGALGALDTDVGAIGIGDSFGLFRWAGSTPGDGVQVGISAGVFAQFDLAEASFDLINADYVVGIPLTLRQGGFSSRLRLYHQSSHLGDEFLLRTEPERINLAFESLELILSHVVGPVRMYGGGEYLFHRDPDDLEEWLAQVGAEARFGSTGSLLVLGAVDVKSSEEQDWKPAWSVRSGIEVGFGRDAAHPPRRWSLLLEYYDGPSPYGQFYREQVRFYGVGLHLSL